jgi:hypothetical protein
MTDFTGVVETCTRVRDWFSAVICATASSHTDLIDLIHDDYFETALSAQVVISQTDVRQDQLDQTRPDQTKPDQTRPDQTRPDQTRP